MEQHFLLEILKLNPNNIQFIPEYDQSEYLQKFALLKDLNCFKYIKKPFESVKEMYMILNPKDLNIIQNSSILLFFVLILACKIIKFQILW